MSELVVIEQTSIPDVFKAGGIEPIIKQIEKEVSTLVPDVSTSKGRKEIASTAHKVARAKTYLDNLGKDLVDGIKKQAGVIDAERRIAKTRLDALKESIRKPLTEWEDAEKERIAAIHERIADFAVWGAHRFETSGQALEALNKIKAIAINDSFAEYAANAAKAKDSSISHVEAEVSRLQKYEAEQAELERLRKESEERERRERDERIAREAAEAAKIEAEEKAKAEKLKSEKREQEAREAAERAEQEKTEAIEKAEREKQEAIEAERVRAMKEAAQKERERIAKEKAEREEAARLAANKEHRKKINNAVLSALTDLGFTVEDSKKFIESIAKGEVPFVTINY